VSKCNIFEILCGFVNNVDAYRSTLASGTSTKVQNRTDVVNNNMQSGGGGNVESGGG